MSRPASPEAETNMLYAHHGIGEKIFILHAREYE